MADGSRERLKVALEDLKTEMHELFPAAVARLAQLDKHVDTVAMVVECIHDEEARDE